MDDSDSSVRREAAESLGCVTDQPSDFDRLMHDLSDPDRDIRQGAIKGLGEIGDPRAIDPLLESLYDEDQYVQQAASLALWYFGDERMVEPLIKALKHENVYVRENAAEVLGSLGDIRAVEPLVELLLHDEYDWARTHAVSSLRDLDKAWATELLTKALEDEDSKVRDLASDALKRLRSQLANRGI